MNRLVETFMRRRGYTQDYMDAVNNSAHPPLKSISEMCEALHEIHDKGSHIVILPDFDMDGIMSGTVGFAGLSELGFNVSLYRPDPSEGYGFTAKTINDLVAEYPDVQTIITCDVGITCYEGVETAQAKGIQVLVTDHHVQEAVGKLKAEVIVDPNRVDDTYPNKGICGAHVFWQVLQHYADRYGTVYEQEQIRRLRVYAGIGTISDSMPLLYENRSLVLDACDICRLVYGKSGEFFLQHLQGSIPYVRSFWGLHYALQVFADNGKISDAKDIDEEFFGFYLAPCFNALKRLNGDMNTAFGVYFGNTPLEDASTLYNLNEQRKQLVSDYYSDMMSSYQPYAPYVYISDAQPGILGLLATKVINATGRPVMVLRRNDDGNGYHGSGRTPSWFQALDLLRPEGFYIAGHQNAFGIGVNSDEQLKKLHDSIEEKSDRLYAQLDPSEFEDEYDILIATDGSGDTDIDIPLFLEYMHEIKGLRPFGVEFQAPKVRLKFKASEGDFTTIGSSKQHLKINLIYGFQVLCWNQSHIIHTIQDDNCDIIVDGKLGLSEFQGSKTVNMTGDVKVIPHEE